jgi:hypothetical protein
VACRCFVWCSRLTECQLDRSNANCQRGDLPDTRYLPALCDGSFTNRRSWYLARLIPRLNDELTQEAIPSYH